MLVQRIGLRQTATRCLRIPRLQVQPSDVVEVDICRCREFFEPNHFIKIVLLARPHHQIVPQTEIRQPVVETHVLRRHRKYCETRLDRGIETAQSSITQNIRVVHWRGLILIPRIRKCVLEKMLRTPLGCPIDSPQRIAMKFTKKCLCMFAITAGVIDALEGLVETPYPVQCGLKNDVCR